MVDEITVVFASSHKSASKSFPAITAEAPGNFPSAACLTMCCFTPSIWLASKLELFMFAITTRGKSGWNSRPFEDFSMSEKISWMSRMNFCEILSGWKSCLNDWST